MKLFPVLGLTTLLATGPLFVEALLSPHTNSGEVAIAQTANPTATQSKVQLQLSAAKKSVTKNSKGESVVTWKPLVSQSPVTPGDVLRYTFTGKNNSDRPIKNLVIVQPIHRQTVYNLNSASFAQGTGKLAFSLDKGKTFVEKPLVQVKLSNGTMETRPAPASLYTNIRFQFSDPIQAQQSVSGTYEVTVR